MKPKILVIICTLLFFSNGIAQSIPSSDSIIIKINIPNVFTPAGHTPNEKFCVQKSDSSNIVKFEMKIYNRWGELLFVSDNINKCWDGKFKKKECPMDAYVFQISIDLFDQVANRELNGYIYNGTVTLVR